MIHRDAYRKYWIGSSFILCVPPNPETSKDVVARLLRKLIIKKDEEFDWLRGLKEEDISHISALTLYKTDCDEFHHRFREGVWSTIKTIGDTSEFSCVLFAKDRVYAANKAGFLTSKMINLWSHQLARVREMTGQHLKAMEDAELERLKKAANKIGLTKREIVTVTYWS